jgi:hypothetical protein
MFDVLVSFWLLHAPVLPVLLPVFTAVVLLLLGDGSQEVAGGGHGDSRQRWARRLAMASVLIGLLMAVGLVSLEGLVILGCKIPLPFKGCNFLCKGCSFLWIFICNFLK